MSSHTANYTQPQQLRFITSWFKEWSELQRTDFAAVLAQKLRPGLYVNGLVCGLERMGRPPSIFQCQVRLFQEWTDAWTAEQRQQLRELLVDVDGEFAGQLSAALVDGGGDGVSTPSALSEEELASVSISAENASLDSQTSELTPTEM